MPVQVASLKDIAPIHLPGRDLQWLVTPQTVGVTSMSVAIMTCQPHAVVRPLHAHKDIDEVIYIVQGQGETWVEGERATFRLGDAVLFPANAPHQVRNTGDEDLIAVCIFSGVTDPDSYIKYDRDVFSE